MDLSFLNILLLYLIGGVFVLVCNSAENIPLHFWDDNFILGFCAYTDTVLKLNACMTFEWSFYFACTVSFYLTKSLEQVP